jgi:uncharacterized protein (TIGR00730 family)
MARVCVFCGSRPGDTKEFRDAAEALGAFLADHDHTLVYGGGGTGMMRILADSVLRHGGNVIGIIPKHLANPELMHDGVADMRITVDMHERKALMHSLADAYLALPGGYGTLEELFEAVTWAQLELHAREVAVLNICGLFDGLSAMLDRMTACGFLSQSCRRHLRSFSSVEQALEWISALPTDS